MKINKIVNHSALPDELSEFNYMMDLYWTFQNRDDLADVQHVVCDVDGEKHATMTFVLLKPVEDWLKENGDETEWKYGLGRNVLFFKDEAFALAFKMRWN